VRHGAGGARRGRRAPHAQPPRQAQRPQRRARRGPQGRAARGGCGRRRARGRHQRGGEGLLLRRRPVGAEKDRGRLRHGEPGGRGRAGGALPPAAPHAEARGGVRARKGAGGRVRARHRVRPGARRGGSAVRVSRDAHRLRAGHGDGHHPAQRFREAGLRAAGARPAVLRRGGGADGAHQPGVPRRRVRRRDGRRPRRPGGAQPLGRAARQAAALQLGRAGFRSRRARRRRRQRGGEDDGRHAGGGGALPGAEL
ncbi:MAG: Enoyl-CoA hydratase, partial [uncultured Gemmatimonadetes bacterium]